LTTTIIITTATTRRTTSSTTTTKANPRLLRRTAEWIPAVRPPTGQAALSKANKEMARDTEALDRAENDLAADQKQSSSLESLIKVLEADIAEDKA
jgi:hypothetical protein